MKGGGGGGIPTPTPENPQIKVFQKREDERVGDAYPPNFHE